MAIRAPQLTETAATVAARIASFSPIAVRMGMKAFRDTTGHLHEGATVFLEKRQPKWVGR
jgi:hypothetical protein